MGVWLALLAYDVSQAMHTRPKEPRLILVWDGVEWQVDRVADGYLAAQRILHGIEGDGVVRAYRLLPAAEKPRDRHRKPR